MARQSWRMVGVNMTDDDKARLDALSHLWGTSNAATVRRLIQDATKGLLPSERDGHTCPPAQFDRYGCSNPMAAKGACVACWPTPPNPQERHEGEIAYIMARGTVDEWLPWWAWTHRNRQGAWAKHSHSLVDNEILADRLGQEPTSWEEENRQAPVDRRLCTARTKGGRGPRCKRRPMAGTFTTCGLHTPKV